jgi:hypothetical protein
MVEVHRFFGRDLHLRPEQSWWAPLSASLFDFFVPDVDAQRAVGGVGAID